MTDHKELIARKYTRNMLDVLRDALSGADRVVVETRNALGTMDAYYLRAPEILDALEAQAEQVAVVNPLEWTIDETRTAFAQKHYFAGDYCIEHRLHADEVFDLWLSPEAERSARCSTLEAAKAIAQADYERRILSALTIRSADEVRAEERERCAGIARNRWKAWTDDSGVSCDATACEDIAAAIMGGDDE